MEAVTRFAPSPTGLLHIGAIRTALYSYIVAKKNKGRFFLRIEDTDRRRVVKGSVEDIIDTLKWLGLNFDGEVIFQSRRQDIYKEHAKILLDEGKAYEEEGAIWFKMKTDGRTSTVDLVGNRKLEIPNKGQKDFVILKSDGFPTYHLAHVVDDHLMQTNPVIRGQEWISSVPKHIALFEAFGWEPTKYAHVPIILGSDRAKLSKRHGAKATSEFRRDGFLPEAILNYIAFLGWTPRSGKEILSLEEMAEEFDLKDVHVSSPIFDSTKLEWMNGEYIRKSQNSKLKSQIWEYLMEISDGAIARKEHPNQEDIERVIPLIKERIKKLSDFVPLTDFLWEAPEYDKAQFQKLDIKNQKEVLEKVLKDLEKMQKPWNGNVFEKTFRDLAKDLGISTTLMFQLIRVAVSGQIVTPPLFESIKILGEKETVERVKQASSFLREFPE